VTPEAARKLGLDAACGCRERSEQRPDEGFGSYYFPVGLRRWPTRTQVAASALGKRCKSSPRGKSAART
jgi:hypothetical protein